MTCDVHPVQECGNPDFQHRLVGDLTDLPGPARHHRREWTLREVQERGDLERLKGKLRWILEERFRPAPRWLYPRTRTPPSREQALP